MLIPSAPQPEWMLIYGDPWVGKTYNALSIMDTLAQMGGDERAYFIDTDWAAALNAQHFPNLRVAYRGVSSVEGLTPQEDWDQSRIRAFTVTDFAEVLAATEIIRAEARPMKDWIIVDRSSMIWKFCPEHYVTHKLKKTMEEIDDAYSRTEEGKSRGGNSLLQFYQTGINPLYFRWEKSLMWGTRCHTLFVASETEIITQGMMKDSKEIISMFRPFGGMKPEGQRDVSSRFHTILRISLKNGVRVVNTCRERGNRQALADKAIEATPEGPGGIGFYLLGVAKWQLR